MASVFGYAKVTKVITLAENRHAHFVYDEDLKEKQVVLFKEKLPINTLLYWEYFLGEDKTHWMVIPE